MGIISAVTFLGVVVAEVDALHFDGIFHSFLDESYLK
jgi:hypothetical protein